MAPAGRVGDPLRLGPSGVEATRAEAVVIIDVLRFTTAVDAAVGRGAVVLPCRWKDGTAQRFAEQQSALLADPGDPRGPSLSPLSLLGLKPGDRVVLPSPNGSACAAAAAARQSTVVVAGCLRNVRAVTHWLNQAPRTVAVIACGERWPDGALRPSLEDYLGAGAVISGLQGRRSPEAEMAANAWVTERPNIGATIANCVSGREVAARGWEADLAFALDIDASNTVPILRRGGFVDAGVDGDRRNR